MLNEAWFIDGLRQFLGKTIFEGRIVFLGEVFNDTPYHGIVEDEYGGKYEGYFKDHIPHGKGKIYC